MTNENYPIVYLDIDEVLNTYDDVLDIDQATPQRKYIEYGSGSFVEKEKLYRLHRLLATTNAKVVIVSSWANGENEDEIGKLLGLDIHSKALYTGGGDLRGKNVTLHREKHGITNYVVIDDGDVMYTNEPNLVSVNGRIGLTWENVFDALCILYKYK